MVAPDVYLYKEHRRHGERLAIEDSRHYFATAPFYFFLVIRYALPGCQHIIYDDNLFPFDISGNEVVSVREYAFLHLWLHAGFLVHRKYQRRTVLKLNPVGACRCTSRAV